MTSGHPLIYVAGQVAQNGKGELVGNGDFSAQVAQAFQNLAGVLKAAGAGWNDVVKLNYYVVGLNGERLQAIRAERNRHFAATALPASTLVGVQGLFSPDALIEIEAIAESPAP